MTMTDAARNFPKQSAVFLEWSLLIKAANSLAILPRPGAQSTVLSTNQVLRLPRSMTVA